LLSKGIQDEDRPASSEQVSDTGAIPLPDIKQVLRKKQMEEELARMAEEKEEMKVRISRKDKVAFAKVQ
jgi:hypothetical protein